MFVKAARLVLAASALAAGSASLEARAALPRVSAPVRSGIVVRARPQTAVAPTYTIHSIGTPAGYDYSVPYGFNDTGQIFGIADTFAADQSTHQDCMLWTGSSFRRLPLPSSTLPGTSCTPSGINARNAASGEYEIVGSAYEQYSFGTRAFAVLATAAGFKRTTIYYAYASSLMAGVNGNQVALATAAFSRDSAYDLQGMPYFTTTAVANSLTQLQPLATAGTPAFHYLIPTYASPCPFGGCAINDRNEVLGYDYLTVTSAGETAALYTVGNPGSLVHLPIQDSFNGVPPFGPVAFNNANQLVYFVPALDTTAIYNVDTGVRTVIPVSPPGCATGSASPISMNDRGAVLGIDQCPLGNVYWTWDPVNGTQYLAAQIPANAYSIFPLGINDSGQILVTLQTATPTSTTTDWGTLDPLASTVKRVRSARR